MAPLDGDPSGGIRSRNFSQLHGYRVYEYEFYYHGSYCDDIITSCTVHLDVADSTIASYQQFQATIFKNVPVDATFELYSLISVFHTPDELQRSIFLRLEDMSEDYRTAFLQCEIVEQILQVLHETTGSEALAD